MIAASMTLIPAHLLELRYFTPGIIILLINHRYQPLSSSSDYSTDLNKKATVVKEDNRGIYVMVAIFLLIDLLLKYIFLYRSFIWVDGSTARFMF
jgi:hypothetical protein